MLTPKLHIKFYEKGRRSANWEHAGVQLVLNNLWLASVGENNYCMPVHNIHHNSIMIVAGSYDRPSTII